MFALNQRRTEIVTAVPVRQSISYLAAPALFNVEILLVRFVFFADGIPFLTHAIAFGSERYFGGSFANSGTLILMQCTDPSSFFKVVVLMTLMVWSGRIDL